jgi:hypothetical protein
MAPVAHLRRSLLPGVLINCHCTELLLDLAYTHAL